MKTANNAELKNGLSKFLAEVKRGGEVLVSDRNVPFAKIVPLKQTDAYDAEELELIAKGLMALPEDETPLPDSFWDEERPEIPLDKILRVIRDERDED